MRKYYTASIRLVSTHNGTSMVPDAKDCQRCAERDVSDHYWLTIVRDLMLAGFCLLLFVGCDPCSCEPSADIKARAAELSSGFKKSTDTIVSKQDETLTALAAIKSLSDKQIELNTEIVSLLKQKEAPLSSADLNRKDGDPAATEPQEAAKANQPQSHQPVASPPAVRSSSVVMKWDIEGNKNPSMLETSRHLLEDHGIIADGMTHQQMHDAHAAAHEGRPVAMKSQTVRIVNQGTYCPNGQCPTSRQSVRMRWRR